MNGYFFRTKLSAFIIRKCTNVSIFVIGCFRHYQYCVSFIIGTRVLPAYPKKGTQDPRRETQLMGGPLDPRPRTLKEGPENRDPRPLLYIGPEIRDRRQ